jgi:hypothetical protein
MNDSFYIEFIKRKIKEHELTDSMENSKEFTSGLLIGLETMYHYFTSNYRLTKKRNKGRNRCQAISKGKRKKLLLKK